MTAPGADPVEACAEEYAAALAGALRGPARAKARMVEEIRDGFADTVTAHAGAGLPTSTPSAGLCTSSAPPRSWPPAASGS